jgi:hypothetical protein
LQPLFFLSVRILRFGKRIPTLSAGQRINSSRYRMRRSISARFPVISFGCIFATAPVERTLLIRSPVTQAFPLSPFLSLQMVRYDFGRQVDRRRPCTEGNALTSPLIPIQKKRRRKRGMPGGWKGWKGRARVMHSPRAPGYTESIRTLRGGCPLSCELQRAQLRRR